MHNLPLLAIHSIKIALKFQHNNENSIVKFHTFPTQISKNRKNFNWISTKTLKFLPPWSPEQQRPQSKRLKVTCETQTLKPNLGGCCLLGTGHRLRDFGVRAAETAGTVLQRGWAGVAQAHNKQGRQLAPAIDISPSSRTAVASQWSSSCWQRLTGRLSCWGGKIERQSHRGQRVRASGRSEGEKLLSASAYVRFPLFAKFLLKNEKV